MMLSLQYLIISREKYRESIVDVKTGPKEDENDGLHET
jgi:hypothetical protein